MNNLNSILIEGNMVREPLFRTTPKGTPVCTFSLASNRYLKRDVGFEETVSFFDIETWAQLAESCNNQGRKGRGVRVVGRLKQDRWIDPEGKPRSRIMIVAEHVEFRPEFGRSSALGRHASAARDDDIAYANSADDAGDDRDDALCAEYEESQAMANAPAAVMF